MEEPLVRLATALDLAAIESIYDHYVHNSTCTFQLESEPFSAREAWFSSHDERHPVTVATLSRREGDALDGRSGGEVVVGWASISVYNSRCGYASTVENSVYVRAGQHGRGIGRALLTDCIARAEAIGHHTIIAGVGAEQTPSLALHESLGFVRVALLREVGFKFGRWLDVVYLQKMLGAKQEGSR